ncbi:MAG: PSD1 and planctomycete cytochrome C domain-containing protein [Bryobacteraceae bacterium]|nr:PSD1 and planctomycete cytochrome C domain-containing protein [Bryobacteraceae bacterium]
MRAYGILLFLLAVSAPAADFGKDIQPLLAARCGACHAAQVAKSGFSIASFESVRAGGKKHGRAVLGGQPETSPLLQMVRGTLAPRMPMGAALAPAEIALLEAWVRELPAEAATAKSAWRWPYEKPVKPAVPAGAAHPIDAFLLAKLSPAQMAPPAARHTLARRVYLDLLGLPPTPAELDSFLRDTSPDAYPKLIDRLLADPRYGERWGRHWLDLVRYGETSGLEGDGAIGNAWRYRDWVIDAFNQDLPYDRFVRAQLAGADEHSQSRNNYAPDVQGHIPLGFLRVAPWDRSNLVADEVRANYLSEITTTTGSVFLGLSVGCARCHDHKYDPIPQADFYRLQAFFNAIQVEDVSVPFRDPEFAALAKTQVEKYEKLTKDGPEKKALEAHEQALLPKLIAYRKAHAAKEPGISDLRLEIRRNDHRLFTVAESRRHASLKEDADRTQDPAEKQALEAYEGQLLPRLKGAYAQPGFDALGRFEVLTVDDVRAEASRQTSKIFSAEDLERHHALSETIEMYQRRLGRWQPTALTVRNVPGPPSGPGLPPVRVLVRGDYRQPGEIVEAGFLSAITGRTEAAVIESDRYRQFPTRGWRMTLAKWIASPENPLTARVMVNRIWQQHFGRGIVATPSDFGVNGERPTHPELLDWLAHAFVENGWSIKQMHRLMLTSAAYQQSAENPRAVSRDPENHLLWHFSRRRLSAEEIRDSILQFSQRLSPDRGGPSVFPALPADLADFARYGRGGASMWETNEKETDLRRRSVYTFQRRSLPLPMMAAFDATAFSESCERRTATTTPLQALSLMNSEMVHEEASHLAKRLTGDRPSQISQAFALILGRAATGDEVAKLSGYSGGLEGICRILLNSNEFLYVD